MKPKTNCARGLEAPSARDDSDGHKPLCWHGSIAIGVVRNGDGRLSLPGPPRGRRRIHVRWPAKNFSSSQAGPPKPSARPAAPRPAERLIREPKRPVNSFIRVKPLPSFSTSGEQVEPREGGGEKAHARIGSPKIYYLHPLLAGP